jgi:hypothetical protein
MSPKVGSPNLLTFWLGPARLHQIQDLVTKNLLNMAFVHVVKRVHLEKRDSPSADLDMLVLVNSLKDFFAEHDVIARTFEGEKLGAWFEG